MGDLGAGGRAAGVAHVNYFTMEYLRDAGPGQAAAAASLLPRGCWVTVDGGHRTEATSSLPAAVEVVEEVGGRQMKRFSVYSITDVGPRLAKAAGEAGAEHLELKHVGLADEGSRALADAYAVAASVAGGTMRRLELSYDSHGDPAWPLLADLGAALQRGGPGPCLELQVRVEAGFGVPSGDEQAAVHAALAAMLGRVSLLSLPVYSGGEIAVLVVRSQVLRRLEIFICKLAARCQLPLRIDAAPALESVRLEYVFPSVAARLLVALASDPSLPALQEVELTLADEGSRHFPYCGLLAPVAGGVRRALEQRAGGAAAGAALGEWRVEVVEEVVVREDSRYYWAMIRALRPR